MTRTAPVEQHLQQGERILWSAGVVEEFYRLSISHRIKVAIGPLVLCVAAMICLGFTLAGLLQPEPHTACGTGCSSAWFTGDFFRPVKIAICVAVLAAFAVTACALLLHVNCLLRTSPHSPTDWFAVTSRRLLELDRSGALLDQVEKAEITRLKLTHRDDQQILIVHRERKHIELAPFKIAFVERPAEAKAIIEKDLLGQPA
ncbi:MAG TPA: hypothetical protein VGO52_24135 [Hyphomonadaceae bacterium]|jgi:hypothetical protein|nr:hypothetical protein [Hyphomonadaceae bacterium]